MSSAETTGRTRMSVAGRGDPPPRRVMPGQARRCGLGRTSKVSSPRRIRVPATMPVCARERARTGRSRRARIAGAPGARRSSARESRVEKEACSRATLGHDRGTSPARPIVPGGEDQPDVWAANARQVQARAQGCARQATSIVHASTLDPASCAFKRLRRACGQGGKGKVFGGQLARALWAWPPRVRPPESAPPLGAAKCDNGPHV